MQRGNGSRRTPRTAWREGGNVPLFARVSPGVRSGEDFDRVAVWIVKDNIHRFTADGFRRWDLQSSPRQLGETSFQITYGYHDEPTTGALAVSDDVYQACGRHLPNSLVPFGDNVRRT